MTTVASAGYPATEETWEDRALRAVYRVAARMNGACFSVAAVWEELGKDRPQDGRKIARILFRAEGNGWIKRTTNYQPSEVASCHGAPRMVWRALL